MSGLNLHDLAGDYLEMVRLHHDGAKDAASVLYHRIARLLRDESNALWSGGVNHLAEGDHAAALTAIDRILELHRQNFAGIPMPIGKAACYEQIARLREAAGQPVAATAAAALAARDGQSFYRPAPSCQISILGGLYEILFGESTDGTFVEVGAFDGEMFSNTSCLADLGWRGLYIEPVERSYLKCVERHVRNARVSVLNCAIGPEDKTITFWDNGQFSTGSRDELAVNQEHGWQGVPVVEEIQVRQMRLDAALEQARIAPGFDLLVIDVDGMEEAVFASFELERWRPKCLLVELIDDSPGFVGHDSLIAASARARALVQGGGYETLYRDGGNTLFRYAGPA